MHLLPNSWTSPALQTRSASALLAPPLDPWKRFEPIFVESSSSTGGIWQGPREILSVRLYWIQPSVWPTTSSLLLEAGWWEPTIRPLTAPSFEPRSTPEIFPHTSVLSSMP